MRLKMPLRSHLHLKKVAKEQMTVIMAAKLHSIEFYVTSSLLSAVGMLFICKYVKKNLSFECNTNSESLLPIHILMSAPNAHERRRMRQSPGVQSFADFASNCCTHTCSIVLQNQNDSRINLEVSNAILQPRMGAWEQ